MIRNRKHYTIALIVIALVVGSLMVGYYLFSIREVGKVYADKTKETIIQSRKKFLKDTINNLIVEIDVQRRIQTRRMSTFTENAAMVIRNRMRSMNQPFRDFIADYFENDRNAEVWTVVVWSRTQNSVIYDPRGIAADTLERTVERMRAELVSFQTIEYVGQTAVFGVRKRNVDDRVRSDMLDTIRSLKFDNGMRVWVNAIVDYNGGDHYAIRLVNPDSPKGEGVYLSTEMSDVKGNQPYLTELEAIKKDGELFSSYFLKEPDSNVITEKLTYAKLYRDFNWVIATGIPMQDLESYVEQTNSESQALVSRLTYQLVLLFIALVVLGYGLLLLNERMYTQFAKKLLEAQVNEDALTKARSRRSGMEDLTRAFKEFQRSGNSPAILMFDIDRFKEINDTYGHTVGDITLIEIVKAVKDAIRSTDRLVRWGGDEFIIIFYGLKKKKAAMIGDKIRAVVSSLEIPTSGDPIHPTVSVGISYFRESDADSNDVLKRVDHALYKSKSNGRNQVNLFH